jgi:hypothetical protein
MCISHIAVFRYGEFDVQANSGQAVVHEHSLFVTNLVNRIDQYTILTMEHIKTFPYAIIQNYPLQVAIVKETEWIMSGGDDGFT